MYSIIKSVQITTVKSTICCTFNSWTSIILLGSSILKYVFYPRTNQIYNWQKYICCTFVSLSIILLPIIIKESRLTSKSYIWRGTFQFIWTTICVSSIQSLIIFINLLKRWQYKRMKLRINCHCSLNSYYLPT